VIGGILFIIIALLVFGYLSRLRIQFLHQRLKSKQLALQAQMNPHFISNSLNAIESLINLNENRKASEYLVKFSRLSRMVLYHCREDQISIQAEMEMLHNYLALEKLRMSERLTYSIHVGDNLDPNYTHIPPMLIQPFVENAIWHGIKPKEGLGAISIQFLRNSQNELLWVIEDNGIGRKKSREQTLQSAFPKISYSTRIIQERIHLLEDSLGARFQIIDLKNKANEPVGTRVEVFIHFSQSLPTYE
jgi:sensor histidine kinase YesM